ncbi:MULTISPECIES: hypothetical protein [unclassified Streptomyces]|uniref:hypothetical protein n=1 Tax=unclassified Streptomyces TaxID=2593676 RepID=UPI001CC15A55|nr:MULTISPECIES: hypothetical protein [unclassified Streptomyces]WPO75268.1 hypothetical protein R9806_34010 [Streptomyces sp. KN37]
MGGDFDGDFLVEPGPGHEGIDSAGETADGQADITVRRLRFLGSMDQEPPSGALLACVNGHITPAGDWCEVCGHPVPGTPLPEPVRTEAAEDDIRVAEDEADPSADSAVTALSTVAAALPSVLARPPRPSKCVNLAARLLPGRDRERWVEEWQAEWFDLASRSPRVRAVFVARVILHSGPRLAWLLRVRRPKETA